MLVSVLLIYVGSLIGLYRRQHGVWPWAEDWTEGDPS